MLVEVGSAIVGMPAIDCAERLIVLDCSFGHGRDKGVFVVGVEGRFLEGAKRGVISFMVECLQSWVEFEMGEFTETCFVLVFLVGV